MTKHALPVKIQCKLGDSMIKFVDIDDNWFASANLEQFDTYGSSSIIYKMPNGLLYKRYHWPVSAEEGPIWIEYLERIALMESLEGSTLIKPEEIYLKGTIIDGYTMPIAPGKLLCDMEDIPLKKLLDADAVAREDIIQASSSIGLWDVNTESLFFDEREGFTIVDFDDYHLVEHSVVIPNLELYYKCILRSLLYTNDEQQCKRADAILKMVLGKVTVKEECLNLKEFLAITKSIVGQAQSKKELQQKAKKLIL